MNTDDNRPNPAGVIIWLAIAFWIVICLAGWIMAWVIGLLK